MKKLVAMFLTLLMLVSIASFALATEVPEGYPELILDKDGNVVDLGGIEVIIADYWSAADGTPNPATDAATEAQYEWRDWIQETYNFKISQRGLSDWEGNPEAFLNFASTGGDENYMWIMRPDSVATPMGSGLLYDLASIDCLDLTDPRLNAATMAAMSNGDSVYGVSHGAMEPRQVVFFNKRLVEDAGIDPESIYDLQLNNEWTWDKFVELLQQCNRDTDNDGVIDSYAMASNTTDVFLAAVANNNGRFFDFVDGKYVVTANSDEAVEALTWAVDTLKAYQMPQPDGSEWNWFFAAFKNGQAAFSVIQSYSANPGSDLDGMVDDFGMVAFPTGPKAAPGSYKTRASENITVMPNVYDADRAWKIAFAWQLWTAETPGYEDSLDPEAWKSSFYNRFRDDRAVDETYAMLREGEHVVVPVMLGSDNDVLGQDFFWDLSGYGVTVAEAIEKKMPAWQGYLDIANGITKAE